MKSNPTIYISYAWSNTQPHTNWSSIVSQLYTIISSSNEFEIKIDIESIGYKDDIKNFMRELGKGNYIIVEISEKYLKSKNCMFEAVEMLKNPNFKDRIFPILTEDAKIYNTDKIIEYIKYWDAKIQDLNNEAKSLSSIAYAKPILEDIELFSEIRRVIAQFGSIIGDMNVLSPEKHKNSDFTDIMTQIRQKVENDIQDLELLSELQTLRKENGILKDSIEDYKTKFAKSILLSNQLNEKIKELENENEILNKVPNKVPQDIFMIKSENSTSPAKIFKEFLNFNHGDNKEKISEIFGNPSKEIHNKEHLFDSLYYDNYLDFTFFRETNTIQTVSISSNQQESQKLIAFLERHNITDEKMHFIGKHKNDILANFGHPYSVSSGNYTYWFLDFLVTFICYEHSDEICTNIKVQYFY